MMMKFDVFVSFRGIDTRRTFVSHLLLSLSKKRIKTFKNEEEIPNHPPSAEVLMAIDKSKTAIVVISKNYASICCLDELAKIIECKERGSLVVVPVFYEVDPSDVIRQVDNHLGNHNNLEKVKRWRDALEKLVQIYHQQDYSHWEDEDSYSNIVDNVTSYVSHCLSVLKTHSKEEHLTDASEEEKFHHRVVVEPCPYARIDIINEERRRPPHKEAPDSTSLRKCFPYIILLVIKLVRAAFRKIVGRFMYGEKPSGIFVSVKEEDYVIGNNLSRLVLSNDSNSFVGMDRLLKEVYTLLDLESRDRTLEIGILGERGVGKTTLAKCVYKQISPHFQDYHYFMENTKNCSQKEELKRFNEVMKATLGHRKVLLIVDDVDSRKLDHFRKLTHSFGRGSRLIFVTNHQEIKRKIERVYVVESLRYDEALKLFSQFAFKQEQVPRDYHQLSVRAVTVTGRIPLALKVFGSFLCGKVISEWEHELCRLEAPKCNWDCVAKVSTYIGNALS